ncbi:Retrovirus-related Pol polyprotein from transposon TNT 1-94 [Vitis vinifera]|uniref:Retrovirus-related Pol polyprotein from transposon TNT 1-94 n=1 Tax=Vitis vinifera TaxID=29760 RepID=A0A438DD19_VITVI|nr:Retrovirus-related Pol polyprotein from transposon TNT 1-94 [Vitis vinifera]
MAEEAGKTSGIEKFDGTDFAYWRLQVLGVIRLTLSRSVAHNVVKEKTTTDLMKALSDMYEKPSANNKVHLMKKLFNLKMAENASVAQHLNEFNTITNQLSFVEIDFDDAIHALIVLASLSNSWEAMKMAISNYTGKEKFKYNDIRDLIMVEEIRRRDAGETSGSCSALNFEIRDKGHFRKQCKSSKKKNEDDSANACNRRALDVVDLGDIRISLPNGFVWLLEKVTKGARVLAREKKTGTLYMTSCPRDTIAVADASTDTSLWHRRLGHMSEKGMKMKAKKCELLENWQDTKAEKLELVHTDLWRPSPVASLGGSRYYITFIDDSSKKVDVVSTIAYLINRGPSVPMEFRLPEEVWSGNESKICFFIGYGDEKFGYRGEKDKENVNSQVDLSTPVVEVCRSSRNIRPPQRYSPVLNYLLLTYGGEPECYDEALQDENSSKWELAMNDEMDSLLGNRT